MPPPCGPKGHYSLIDYFHNESNIRGIKMNSEKFTSASKVCEFVNNNPDHAIEILNNFDIDFCCGGFKTLEQACGEKGLDHEQILSQLVDDSKKSADVVDWALLDTTDLVDHIVGVHHMYLKETFPKLDGLMEKVINAHGENHPELFDLQKVVRSLRADLEPHMMKEENILFPMIKSLDGSLESAPAHCGSVANPIRVMMADHEHAGMILEKIKTMTNNYSPPEDACETYRLLFKTLKQIEADLLLHVHKENNLLFPQALSQVA